MDDRYVIPKIRKDKYIEVILAFISKLDNYSKNITSGEIQKKENFTLNFTAIEFNPITLKELMESLGYKEKSLDNNGWQFNFVWTLVSETAATELSRELIIWGTGLTFELNLSNKEYM